jgi:conjugal transfer pilus assembly protein TraK
MKRLATATMLAVIVATGTASAGETGKTIMLAGMEIPTLPVSVMNTPIKRVSEPGMPEEGATGGTADKPAHITAKPDVIQAELQSRHAASKPKNKPRRHGQVKSLRKNDSEGGVKFKAKLVAKIAPGVNEIIKISKAHLNRIITPFDIAVVETASDAEIQSKGSSIYITSTTDYPVTMFVHEKGEDDPSISLTLLPSPIPPRQVKLVFEAESGAFPVAGAKRWENGHPYIKTIKVAMTEIAKGRVPHGYGIRKFRRWKDPYPECENKKQGISVKPGQTIEGHSVIYVVSSVKNVSSGTIELSEQYCYEDGVLAAAFWPSVVLKPGEKTELYTAHQRPQAPSSRQRKSLLN